MTVLTGCVVGFDILLTHPEYKFLFLHCRCRTDYPTLIPSFFGDCHSVGYNEGPVCNKAVLVSTENVLCERSEWRRG